MILFPGYIVAIHPYYGLKEKKLEEITDDYKHYLNQMRFLLNKIVPFQTFVLTDDFELFKKSNGVFMVFKSNYKLIATLPGIPYNLTSYFHKEINKLQNSLVLIMGEYSDKCVIYFIKRILFVYKPNSVFIGPTFPSFTEDMVKVLNKELPFKIHKLELDIKEIRQNKNFY